MTVDPKLSMISNRKSQVPTTFKKIESPQSLMIPQFIHYTIISSLKHNIHIVQINQNQLERFK